MARALTSPPSRVRRAYRVAALRRRWIAISPDPLRKEFLALDDGPTRCIRPSNLTQAVAEVSAHVGVAQGIARTPFVTLPRGTRGHHPRSAGQRRPSRPTLLRRTVFRIAGQGSGWTRHKHRPLVRLTSSPPAKLMRRRRRAIECRAASGGRVNGSSTRWSGDNPTHADFRDRSRWRSSVQRGQIEISTSAVPDTCTSLVPVFIRFRGAAHGSQHAVDRREASVTSFDPAHGPAGPPTAGARRGQDRRPDHGLRTGSAVRRAATTIGDRRPARPRVRPRSRIRTEEQASRTASRLALQGKVAVLFQTRVRDAAEATHARRVLVWNGSSPRAKRTPSPRGIWRTASRRVGWRIPFTSGMGLWCVRIEC